MYYKTYVSWQSFVMKSTSTKSIYLTTRLSTLSVPRYDDEEVSQVKVF